MNERILIGIALAGVLTTGCATQRMMERSARDGADQLAALQTELQQKIRAEQAYHQRSLGDLEQEVLDARDDDYELFVSAQADLFVDALVNGQELSLNQLDTFLQAWSDLESARADLAANLQPSQDSLQASTAEVNALLRELRTLGEARSRKALAKFVVGFIDSTYQELRAAESEE